MSDTEKLIKKLNENKEIRKLKEQQTNKNNTVVRVRKLKKALITLATDLLVDKKIKPHYLKTDYHEHSQIVSNTTEMN